MPLQNAMRWFAEFILEPFAPLKGKLREGLTMTWFSRIKHCIHWYVEQQ
jgi:hypothetical protein